jgi:hypothetical protein
LEGVGKGLAVHPWCYGDQYADETSFLAPTEATRNDPHTLHHTSSGAGEEYAARNVRHPVRRDGGFGPPSFASECMEACNLPTVSLMQNDPPEAPERAYRDAKAAQRSSKTGRKGVENEAAEQVRAN